MASSDLVIRLAIGHKDGPNSAPLRIWSPEGKSDVYAGVRERAGDMKVSMHESGECCAGLTTQFSKQETVAVAAMGGSRHQSKWVRTKHTGLQVVIPLQFVFPESELRNWRQESVKDEKTLWISPPKNGHSIYVSIAFSGQEISDDKWPGVGDGTNLVDSKLLPNGEKVWVLWKEYITTNAVLTTFSEAREHMRQTEPVFFQKAREIPLRDPVLLFLRKINKCSV
jgi:hypothetical protein